MSLLLIPRLQFLRITLKIDQKYFIIRNRLFTVFPSRLKTSKKMGYLSLFLPDKKFHFTLDFEVPEANIQHLLSCQMRSLLSNIT